MTAPAYDRFPRSIIKTNLVMSDYRWSLAERGATPFSDFFGLATLSEGGSRTALRTDRPTPLSSSIRLPLLWRRQPKVRLRTGRLFALGRG
ncbi:MAG: hypothetical protein JXJ18_02715 [Rhodobacteraceae bacterium]|nr:hypothetical protein [Paracoccaceae bacterium]